MGLHATTRHRKIIVGSIVASCGLTASLGTFTPDRQTAPAPEPAATQVAPVPAPATSHSIGPLLDHGYRRDWSSAESGMLLSDVPWVEVPAHDQLVEWLAVYGMDDEYLDGTLKVGITDRIDLEINGERLAGTASPGEILLDSHYGWSEHVLAHEIGHVMQHAHPEVISRGLPAVIPAFERDADCIAAVLLAATEQPPETDCSFEEIELAVQVIRGDPVTVHPDVPSTNAQRALAAAQLATGAPADPETSEYTSEVADGASATPTTGDLIAARARAGLVTGAQAVFDQLGAGPISGQEALARAKLAGDAPLESWSNQYGVDVYALEGLRALAGVDVLDAGEALVVSAWDLTSAASIARVLAARVDGVDRCWGPVLAFAIDGFIRPQEWGFDADPYLGFEALGCTRGQLLADAALWSRSGMTSAVRVRPAAGDDDAIVTGAGLREVLAAAGLRDPYGCDWWALG